MPRPGSTTLARASMPETRNRATIAARSSRSVPVIAPPCRRDSVLDRWSPAGFLLELPEPSEQLALPLPHRLRLTLLGMVVVQQMQDAVDDEQRHLVVERAVAAVRLPLGHGWAHDDIADHGGWFPRLRRRAGAPPALIGLSAAGRDVVIHGKREHVRRAAAAEEPFVEVGHRLLVEHHAGEPHPAEHVDLHLRLLVGPEDGPHVAPW